MIQQHTILIPLYIDWNWPADYQRQTALHLTSSNTIICYCFYKKRRFIEVFLGKNPFKNVIENKQSIYFYTPIDLIPANRIPLIKRLNHLFHHLLLFLLLKKNPWRQKMILWGFHTEVADFRKYVPFPHISLYDCVDYFHSLIPKQWKLTIKREQYIKKNFDIMVVNSQMLYTIHRPDRPDLSIVPLGFSSPKERKRLRIKFPNKPIIGYVGTLNYRIDYNLLEQLIQKKPQWHFVLWGPRLADVQNAIVHTQSRCDRLLSLPNVTHGSSITRDEVYSIIEQFTIGIIPYDTTMDFNKYCFPMKTFEYFYMRKPVVATSIQELKRYAPYVKIARTVSEWEQTIQSLLTKPWPEAYSRKQQVIALQHTWEKKIEAIGNIIKKRV